MGIRFFFFFFGSFDGHKLGKGRDLGSQWKALEVQNCHTIEKLEI